MNSKESIVTNPTIGLVIPTVNSINNFKLGNSKFNTEIRPLVYPANIFPSAFIAKHEIPDKSSSFKYTEILLNF